MSALVGYKVFNYIEDCLKGNFPTFLIWGLSKFKFLIPMVAGPSGRAV